jgi:hypothetical protein
VVWELIRQQVPCKVKRKTEMVLVEHGPADCAMHKDK